MYCAVFETVCCVAKHQFKKKATFVFESTWKFQEGYMVDTVKAHCIMYSLTVVSTSGGSIVCSHLWWQGCLFVNPAVPPTGSQHYSFTHSKWGTGLCTKCGSSFQVLLFCEGWQTKSNPRKQMNGFPLLKNVFGSLLLTWMFELQSNTCVDIYCTCTSIIGGNFLWAQVKAKEYF